MAKPISKNYCATRPRDVAKSKKQHHDQNKLSQVMELLAQNKQLEKKYCNHKLKGNFSDRWECHIEPDWLLVYRKNRNEICFERLGSHSELFR